MGRKERKEAGRAELVGVLAANVRRMREGQGMTQKELAEASGSVLQTVQTLEAGNMWIGARMLEDFASALNAEPWMLLKEAEAGPRRKKESAAAKAARLCEALEACRKMAKAQLDGLSQSRARK